MPKGRNSTPKNAALRYILHNQPSYYRPEAKNHPHPFDNNDYVKYPARHYPRNMFRPFSILLFRGCALSPPCDRPRHIIGNRTPPRCCQICHMPRACVLPWRAGLQLQPVGVAPLGSLHSPRAPLSLCSVWGNPPVPPKGGSVPPSPLRRYAPTLLRRIKK